MSEKKTVGRPRKYGEKCIKNTILLPESIWEWLNGLAENRTQAVMKLKEMYDEYSK